MRSAVVLVGVVSGALALVGCKATLDSSVTVSDAPARASPVAVAAGSCIGVASMIGDTFTVKTIGITVFGNDEKQADIQSWGIDALMLSRVAAHVGPRIATKRVALPKDAFSSLNWGGQLLPDAGAARGERLREYARGLGCARYIVVTRSQVSYGGSNQIIGGLGVVRINPYLPTFPLHAIFTITLYDGQTYRPLRYEIASIGQATFMRTVPAPHREVETPAWPKSAEEVAGNQVLREATRALVTESMDKTLPLLGVLDEMAPPRPYAQRTD